MHKKGVMFMEEIRFKSSLTTEQISDNFKNTDFFQNIMASLNEALAYEKGTVRPETFTRKQSLPNVN